jgi:BirA family biotin operon repressor/biotin-[acetyl-CoA-carboxylase] ligase
VIGKDVDVIKAGSEPVRAHVLDVDSECRLIVRYDDGTQEVLSSGEISIRV